MKKIILIFIYLFFQEAKAQNLIVNGSFEDTLTCQQWINMGMTPHLISYQWYQAIASPDYFNPSVALNFCGASALCPNTPFGYQSAKTGVGFAGFSIGNNGISGYKEVIGAPMSLTMTSNHLYYIEFYLSASNNGKYVTDDIGAYFAVDSLNPDSTYTYNILPQVENPQGNIINDTAGWTKVSGYYTAAGGERFIYIGNFKSDANTTFDSIAGATYLGSYYFLDDVSIIDCTSVGINEQQPIAFNLLQNPVVNSVCFTSPFKINAAKVYNILGVKVKVCEFTMQSNYKIDVADLPRGVYFLQVETIDKRRGVRKFIKL